MKRNLIANFRLILQNRRFTGSKRLISGLFYGRLVFSLLLVSVPANTQASIFSFVNNLFAYNVKASDIVETSSNSQKMALLQPATNSDPNPSKRTSELAVVGGEALLTEGGPTGAAPEITEKPSSDQINLYTVRDGDTLPGIAKMFGVTSNTIRWANNLKAKDVIKKGQVLVILPISGVKYTVKKGDTVQSIAKNFQGDADDILSYNNLSEGEKLAVGDEIIIPDGEVAANENSKTSNKIPDTGKDITKVTTPVTSSDIGANTGPYSDPTGYFRRPLDGGTRTQGLHGHNGVDWGSPVGTPIHAAAEGDVIVSRDSGWNGGYGDYVVISHGNGMQTLYAHMKETAVSVGTHVEKGQIIGYIGMTGDTSGPHVHFEVRGGKNPF